MGRLVLKELLLQRSLAVIMVLNGVLFSVLWKSSEGHFYGGLFGYIIVTVMGGSESKTSPHILLNSLPIPRWKIVGAKYLAFFIHASLMVAISCIIGVLLPTFQVSLAQFVVRVVALLTISALYWPAYFSFEFRKASYWNFFVFIAFVIVFPVLYPLIVESRFGNHLVVFALTALMMAVSFWFSLKFYAKKEF